MALILHYCLSIGGLAIAVPAELRGLEKAWKKYGKLSWAEVIEPAASIAEEGFPISPVTATAIQSTGQYILSGDYPGLK